MAVVIFLRQLELFVNFRGIYPFVARCNPDMPDGTSLVALRKRLKEKIHLRYLLMI